MRDLENARKLLNEQSLTCAFVKGNWSYKSTSRGIKPLLDCLTQKLAEPGFAAADKVVGKAAAFLYVLLGAGKVYATVISRPALRVLESAGIETVYDCLTDAVRSRDGRGFCPMETAVRDIEDPGEALEAILIKLQEINKKNNTTT